MTAYKNTLIGIAVTLSAFLLVSACKREGSATQDVPKDQSPAATTTEATPAVATVSNVAAQAAQGVSDAGQTIATQAQAVAAQAQSALANPPTSNTVAATPDPQAQGLIDRAKALISQEKYQDALKVVQQLANLKLTPEQQNLVSQLKTQIQSALASKTVNDAASTLGNALGGKK